ncbi:MAG: hypothetical protein FWB73_01705 [Treponema sp.]|nr:hypothetical protein [Treponema sp.]
MKKVIIIVLIFSLALPMPQLYSQSQTTNEEEEIKFPQWAKDLRRWDIITFGVFPFSMFFTTFITDMVRWNNANGMNFSEEGRRYAPWPMKSANPEPMTSEEYLRTVLIAIGVSATIALIDFAVVQIKRSIERKRQQARTSSTYEIESRSIHAPAETEEGITDDESANTGGGDD